LSAPRAVVLRTAGTNCDAEAVHALRRAGAEVDLVHLHRLMERPADLRAYGLVLLPGGFTYGDDVASGVVFAVEMRERVLPELRRLVDQGGLVLGICNGFQILARAGLLPATQGCSGAPEASLLGNASGRFECRWVRLEVVTSRSPFLERGQVVECPVAHAEGRFVTRDEQVRARMEAAGQVALVYTEPGEAAGAPAPYPWNPNGSPGGVAGVVDPTGRVLGLMPHPERNVEPWHHPRWTRGTPGGGGLAIFANAVRFLRG